MNKTNTKKPGFIKASVLNWLGVPLDLMSGDFWAAFYGQSSKSGQIVNRDSVMQLSAVWSCVRLISGTLSTLPLNLYERTSNGRVIVRDHVVHTLIHAAPNNQSTSSVFWEAMLGGMLLHGNGFAEKLMFNGRLVGLQFLENAKLGITKKPNGDYSYKYTDNGKTRDIAAANIFRIPGFTLDGNWGVSVIKYGTTVFGSGLAADEASAKTFKNGLMPSIFFSLDKVLKREQRDEFRESLEKVKGSLNAGESPLLEGGMKAEALGIKPSEAQLLETRGYSAEEICRWFLVDPSLVGHSKGVSNYGTGLEQKMIGFVMFCLSYWSTRIQQAISKDLLSPAERGRYYAEFNLDALMRGDSAARAAFYSQMTQNGIYTRDDCREKENLPRRGGNADQLTVQSNLVPIDQLGKSSVEQNARAALLAFLNMSDEHEKQTHASGQGNES